MPTKKKVPDGAYVVLSPKEISRADHGITIVTRPQSDGSMLVAAVKVSGSRGTFLGRPYWNFARAGEMSVKTAVRDVLRWVSKMGYPSKMADVSRHRAKR